MGPAPFERHPPVAATSAPPHLRELHLVTRIPQALFGPQGTGIAGLCYVARTDELYITVPGNRTVNVITPSESNSRVRPVYTAPAPSEPSAVCLVRQTGTLLIANFADANRENRVAFALCGSAARRSAVESNRVNCSSLRRWEAFFVVAVHCANWTHRHYSSGRTGRNSSHF